MSKKKKVTFSLNAFHKNLEDEDIAKQVEAMRIQAKIQESELIWERNLKNANRGYKCDVSFDMIHIGPAIELPKGVQPIAFEFAVLAMHNIKSFDQCCTVTDFTKKFDAFFFAYIQAPKNFHDQLLMRPRPLNHGILQQYVRSYGLDRQKNPVKDKKSEECWRFLLYVSARSCLETISSATDVLNWVTILPDETLVWHILPNFTATYRHQTYTWHGYFKSLKQKKEMDEDEKN